MERSREKARKRMIEGRRNRDRRREKEREEKRSRERDMTGHNYSWKPETMAAAALKEA